MINLYLITEDERLKDIFIDLSNKISNLNVFYSDYEHTSFYLDFVNNQNIIVYDSNSFTGLNIQLIIDILERKKSLFIIYSNDDINLEQITDKYSPFCIINKNHTEKQIYLIIRNAVNQILNQNELEKYKTVFEISRDAKFISDDKGYILNWNKSAERIFGWNLLEIKNTLFFDKIIPEQFLNEFIMSFNSWIISESLEFATKTIEIYGQKKNTAIFPIELTMVKFDYDNKKYVAYYSRDITERVDAKDEIDKLIEEMVISKEIIEQNANDLIGLNHDLYESQIQLKELNANKDKFFSIIAHDLKGPFQNLIGYTDILSKDIKNLDLEDIEELATNLHLSAVQLFKLLENLLHWSRIQRGAIEYTPEDCPLYLVVKQNIDLIKPRALEKKIEIMNTVDETINIFSDLNMLNTVLRNLLSNSLKFTNENGRIEIKSTYFNRDFVVISIKDDGVGIPSEKIVKLFRIDQSVSTPGTKNEQGTGLGLILCKELVEKNGGEIFVESQVGSGTTFKFTVPISKNQI